MIDRQQRAMLLRIRLIEELSSPSASLEKQCWALYESLAAEKQCPFLPGSLCELEIIKEYIGKQPKRVSKLIVPNIFQPESIG
jgi:hypothetical protein